MKKTETKVLGIMSGTSLDGVDVALLKFKKNKTWSGEIINAETVPYPDPWRKKLTEALFYDTSRLQKLNEEYTFFLAEVITKFINAHKITGLEAVCSHGHTIKHEPENDFTLQIGNLPRLASLIDHKVVCDFRVQDVALGGQGAPLVPIGDALLFTGYRYCLNLGGFANVSTVVNNQHLAFDICPVNTVLNYLAEKMDLPYDKDGEIAASGKLDEKLLEELNSFGFYSQKPPKSLGIEWVNQHVVPLLSNPQEISSAMHTYVTHAAIQIAKVFDQNPHSKVLITGGGAFNNFLIQEIGKRTKNKLIIPAPELVNYKEALIFGFLGVLKLRGEINVLKSVTGASKDHSSGVIFKP